MAASKTASMIPTVASADSPIAQLVPYFNRGVTIIRHILNLSASMSRPLLFLSPLPILLYILAPFTVFFDIVTTVFVSAPYKTLTYILDAIYPLYVFCGVACIIGCLLGIAGRVVCWVLVSSVEVEDDRPTRAVKTEYEGKGVMGKGKRVERERVKFET